MTRARGELPEPEENLLGIIRPPEEEEAETKRIAEEKAELRRAGLKRLMGQDWFREWLWIQLTALQTFEHIHAAAPNGAPDRAATQFYLGRRSAGWDLWTLFDDLAPDKTSLMRREASQRPS